MASINSHAPWTGGDASVFDRKKLQLPPQFIDTEVTREYYARYLAEVGLLDQQVGDAMRILKEKNLLQNTLVIFISEQGTQFAGAKWTNWSAGVKSAMVASWYRVSLNPVRRLPLLCNMKTFFLHLSMLQAERCLT
ncbi:sulfatase-like hydrolase/transferase [Bacteroides ovatus]|nr:sulfatase-like hydrolase/transferase [Bacteroides ovatus]